MHKSNERIADWSTFFKAIKMSQNSMPFKNAKNIWMANQDLPSTTIASWYKRKTPGGLLSHTSTYNFLP